nr:uncharacterized protein LOC104120564 [Nicotiana tomentosiformis]
MAVFKLGFILTVLLMTTTMNVQWFSKTNVLAWNVDHDLSRVERSLLPQLNDFVTCLKPCQTNMTAVIVGFAVSVIRPIIAAHLLGKVSANCTLLFKCDELYFYFQLRICLFV